MEAAVSMDKEAILWFHWENQLNPIRNWEELKSLILRYFRPLDQGSLCEQWLSVKQSGSVADYHKEFVEKVIAMGRVPEDIMLGSFVNGLNEWIKRELRLFEPTSLKKAMEWAQYLDHMCLFSNEPTGPPLVSPPVKTSCPKQHSLTFYSKPSNTTDYTHRRPNFHTQPPQPSKPTLKLSEKELREKRAKGLCFRCDGRWSINHVCKNQELSLLVTIEEDPEDEDVPFTEPEEVTKEITMAGISLSSVVGITRPKTMKLMGDINGEPVVILIDSGATNNFISTSLVQRLNLPITVCLNFGVVLGTGHEVVGNGECQNILLSFQGISTSIDLLVLELGHTDVVLGVQWLETLGPVVVDWKQ